MKTQTALTTAAATATNVPVKAGETLVKVDGTFGSGTATLTFSDASGGTYVGFPTAVTFTAAGMAVVKTCEGFLQMVLTGSTGATVNWYTGGISGRAASDA